MNTKLVIYKATIYCFLLMFLNTCEATPQDTTNETTNKFVNAINQKNVQILLKLSSFPFYVEDQEWQPANDGYGYVLGKLNRKIFKNSEKLTDYMNMLIKKVEVESDEGRYVPIIEYPRLRDILGSFSTKGQSHDVFMFFRGMGDVEHIVLLIVNKKTKKIELLYSN